MECFLYFPHRGLQIYKILCPLKSCSFQAKCSDFLKAVHHMTWFWFSLMYWWLSGKEPACQCSRCGFDPWVGKIPWRWKWQPIPVILAWEIPWTEEVGELQSMGSKKWLNNSNRVLAGFLYMAPGLLIIPPKDVKWWHPQWNIAFWGWSNWCWTEKGHNLLVHGWFTQRSGESGGYSSQMHDIDDHIKGSTHIGLIVICNT